MYLIFNNEPYACSSLRTFTSRRQDKKHPGRAPLPPFAPFWHTLVTELVLAQEEIKASKWPETQVLQIAINLDRLCVTRH